MRGSHIFELDGYGRARGISRWYTTPTTTSRRQLGFSESPTLRGNSNIPMI